ncbi:hypothetical protein RCG17_20860 [Neobacillus sp. PS3-12]|jgi:hypothetical protein|uniref:hypothetical protein n=1 Tax=Neobacillus sp. PS3-12 TaxID=3070677 RepID=UPI0027E0B31D|nr:hypothetical protein [Neobacillus sp. PS3-12]WML51850.1 hypothetical protein RCG17_20860 [Neobacillus sp. PS3-12]
MNTLINVLSILIFGILAFSLVATWMLARKQKVVDGDIDTKMAKPIQEHVYLKNPIFFSYGLFFVLVLFIILFVAINFR